MIKSFLRKESNDIPEFYGLTIHYIMGKSEEFEIAQHRIITESQLLEICTKDDKWHLVGLSNVRRLEFDGNFSKVVAEKERLENVKKAKS
jgi:hypothetical protein